MHARDAAPDTGLTRIGLIDDVDAADAFAPQAIRDRDAALTAADDDDVVVDARARPHPIGRIAPGPTQRAARLRSELTPASARAGLVAGPLGRSGDLRERGRGAQAADGEHRRPAEADSAGRFGRAPRPAARWTSLRRSELSAGVRRSCGGSPRSRFSHATTGELVGAHYRMHARMNKYFGSACSATRTRARKHDPAESSTSHRTPPLVVLKTTRPPTIVSVGRICLMSAAGTVM